MRVQPRHPLFARSGQQFLQERLGARVFIAHPIRERAEVGDGGRGAGLGADLAVVPDILIGERIGDHAERFDFGVAGVARRKVLVGGGAVGFEQRDQDFVFVVPFDHARIHHFATAVMLR
ncbi:MAG TPA: hypothetical protein VGQ76_08470 [Thermoanaerobaculia bacterium]|nr:hypothetical protein [Thermoanaerobaculia bacterium]